MQRERVWIALDDSEPVGTSGVAERARRRGFRRFVLPVGSSFTAEADDEVVLRSDDHLEFPGAKGSPLRVPIQRVGRPDDLEKLIRGASGSPIVAVEWTGERMIPLENLLAALPPTSRVWVVGASGSDASRFLGALERGADAVIVNVREPADLDSIEHGLDSAPDVPLSWESVEVTRVAPGGMGDRVLVDTTSLLGPDEGALVGSSAAFLLHVRSEAVGSRYTRPRPFRVNAGAAHSYVLLADGTTRYLSELVAADELLVASPGGETRSVRVGRLKLERRPLLLVEVARKERRFTVFVQDAETVRLSGDSGAVAATELHAGMRLWGVPQPPGRHLGQSIEETVEER